MHGNGTYSMHRVKVYRLSTDGQWEDHGTGHIALEYLEQSDAMGLIVLSEADSNKTLLVHKIKHSDGEGDVYQRAGESTIITWHDSEVNTDFAVSFQEQVGCDTIWQQLQTVRRSDAGRSTESALKPGLPQMGGGGSSVCKGSNSSTRGHDQMQPTVGCLHSDYHDTEHPNFQDLPPAEHGSLEALGKALAHVTPFQKERVATQLLHKGYIPKLLELFKQSEDLEDHVGLGHLYRVVRGIIMLNDASLLEEVLREESVMGVLGALEYDPELKQPQRHREFLQTSVQFKQVVPIADPGVLAKIHQTYRIQYLKDVVLPRTLDDATYATLSSIALFNNVEVISALQQDSAFLTQLFAALKSHDPGDAGWHDLVAFLQEFCNLARHLQQASRQQLYAKLVQLGMFDVLTRIMQHSKPDVKLKATDVLMSFMQHNIDDLRRFLLHQPDHALFKALVLEVIGHQPFLQQQDSQPASQPQQSGSERDGSGSVRASGALSQPREEASTAGPPSGTSASAAGDSPTSAGWPPPSTGPGALRGLGGYGSPASIAGTATAAKSSAEPAVGSLDAAGTSAEPDAAGGTTDGTAVGMAVDSVELATPAALTAGAAAPSPSSPATSSLLEPTPTKQGAAGVATNGPPGVVQAAWEAAEDGGVGAGGLSEQVLELLKALLDPESMEQAFKEKDEFLELFYDQYMNKLLLVLTEDREINRSGKRRVSATMLGHVIDIFSFCVQHHGYRIKYFILRQNVADKILRVMRRREKWLACAAIRFIRVCVGAKDEFYLRYLVRNNLFEPIMNAFFENGDRYNLLNSAVLDLVDLIRRDNLKTCIEHLVQHYSHKFGDIEYVQTFKYIKAKYEQAQDVSANLPDSSNEEDERRRSDDGAGVPIGAIANIRGRTYVFNSTGDPVGTGTSSLGVGGGPGLDSGRGPSSGNGSGMRQLRRRREERELDRDEEDYFKDTDEDEDEDSSNSSGAGREEDCAGVSELRHRSSGPKTTTGQAASQFSDNSPSSNGVAAPGSPPAPQQWTGLTQYNDDDDDGEPQKEVPMADKPSFVQQHRPPTLSAMLPHHAGPQQHIDSPRPALDPAPPPGTRPGQPQPHVSQWAAAPPGRPLEDADEGDMLRKRLKTSPQQAPAGPASSSQASTPQQQQASSAPNGVHEAGAKASLPVAQRLVQDGAPAAEVPAVQPGS